MGLFRRRRDLDLRPLSELHDEFLQRPNAEQLLAEADEYLTRRETDYAVQAERERIDSHAPSLSLSSARPEPLSKRLCGAPTQDGNCGNRAPRVGGKCAAGHRRKW